MADSAAVITLLVGGIVVAAIILKALLTRIRIPAVVGYLLLGFGLGALNSQYGIISSKGLEILRFLGELGVITLLFRVGLESDLYGLLRQLRRASLVWVGDFAVSGLIGFCTAKFILGLPLATSLILASAFTATSVGISVSVWQEAKALKSPNGQLLVDVAEADDISAVVVMALLFAILPAMQSGQDIWAPIGKTTVVFLIKLGVFGAFCFLFSRYIERPLTEFIRRLESPPNPMIMVAGLGMIIAALAGMLGFSLAIGAFFGGLIFSRDPDSVKMEASFLPIYELLSPFFFVGIGLDVNPSVIVPAVGLGLVLVVAASIGKILGAGGPVFFMTGFTGFVLIGASMIPRAEIAMVIMQRGLRLGSWAVPDKVYGAMVMVSAVTCLFSPLIVRPLLKKWPQKKDSK
jgi:Kef-type K+ transport system membrane component KefB